MHGDWRKSFCMHILRPWRGRHPGLALRCWSLAFGSFRPACERLATRKEIFRSGRGRAPCDCKKYDKPGRNVKRGKDGATLSVGIAVKIQRTPAQSRGGGGGRVTTFPNPRRGPVLSFTVSIRQSIGSFFLVGVVAAHA